MERQQHKRSPARWLAPLAVVAVALVTFVIVSGSSTVEDETTESTSVKRTTQVPPDDTTETTTATGKRTYVVEPGDTLSSIAAKTGISLENLQALNPKVDPQALAAGEQLKLR